MKGAHDLARHKGLRANWSVSLPTYPSVFELAASLLRQAKG